MPSPAGQPHAKRIPERLAPKLGTGYSPLSYLKRLPSDEVKIDRSFLAAFPDKSAQAVVGSVIDLCHRLGLAWRLRASKVTTSWRCYVTLAAIWPRATCSVAPCRRRN